MRGNSLQKRTALGHSQPPLQQLGWYQAWCRVLGGHSITPGPFVGLAVGPLTGPPGNCCVWASLVAQRVKHLPAIWETWVQSPGWEDPLEKEMAIHSSTLAWKTPWTEETGRLQSMGSQRISRLRDFTFTFHFHALEKKMATHSSIVAWRIPGMGAWWEN